MTCQQDVECAAARFGKEHPEAGLITGEAWKVKAVAQGGEQVVIKLSDAQAAVTQEEPLNDMEEACGRSVTFTCPFARLWLQVKYRGHA